MLAGRPVAVAHTPAFGCSTKWKSKIDGQLKEMQKIEAEPVTVEPVTADDLKKLRMNPPIRFCSSISGPPGAAPASPKCPTGNHLPHVPPPAISTLVTVSTNYPENARRPEAAPEAARLQPQPAIRLRRYLRAPGRLRRQVGRRRTLHHGDRSGGKVLFEEQGEVDVVALRRIILAHLENETYVGHPAIGRPADLIR